MEKNWNKLGTIVRKRYDGLNNRQEFATLKDAVIDLSAATINALECGHLKVTIIMHRGTINAYSWVYPSGDDYIFMDDCGVVIPVWKVKETFYNIPLDEYNKRYYTRGDSKWTLYWEKRWNCANKTFRNGPVWGIRRRKWHRGSFHHVKLKQEASANNFINHFDEDTKEYGIKARTSRPKLARLWDDDYYGGMKDRTWKRFRKHQYK